MNKNLINQIKVLDLTQRLPGPLGSNILRALGANVTKIEPPEKEDAFIIFSKADPLYKLWYEQMNEDKKIIRLRHSYESIASELEDAQIVFVSKNAPIIEQIKSKHQRPIVIIEVCAAKDSTSMHDINVLAQTSSIDLYFESTDQKIQRPPYLPFAGISFAQQIATEALAAFIKMSSSQSIVHNQVFIDESVTFIHNHFWSKELQSKTNGMSLHNGKFPCYNFYKTKDQKFIALGAVEDKFWLKFIKLLNLPLNIDDRFDTSDETFNIIKNKINALTLSEIKNMTDHQDICLTTIDL